MCLLGASREEPKQRESEQELAGAPTNFCLLSALLLYLGCGEAGRGEEGRAQSKLVANFACNSQGPCPWLGGTISRHACS
jgi:hypothetical protein